MTKRKPSATRTAVRGQGGGARLYGVFTMPSNTASAPPKLSARKNTQARVTARKVSRRAKARDHQVSSRQGTKRRQRWLTTSMSPCRPPPTTKAQPAPCTRPPSRKPGRPAEREQGGEHG